jgi:hypothetical protein
MSVAALAATAKQPQSSRAASSTARHRFNALNSWGDLLFMILPLSC